MVTAAFKQFPWMLALFVLGPLAAFLTGSLEAPDGSHDATLLVGSSPVMGVLAGLAMLAMAGVAGVFGSRVNGCRSGLNCAGIVLVWGASQTAAMDELVRLYREDTPLVMLGVEGAVFALLAVPVGVLVWRAGLGRGTHAAAHPLPEGSPGLSAWLAGGPRGAKGLRPETDSLAAGLMRVPAGASGLGAVGAAVVVGAVICWLLAQDTVKGQAIFAAAVTMLVAVPLGRLAGESLGEQPPVAAFFVGTAALALIGPVAALALHGGSLTADVYAGGLVGVASPVTVDWIAGAFIGIPLGEAWFISMFQERMSAGARAGA